MKQFILTSATVLASIASSSAAVIQFDFGQNTQTTADVGWNNMTGSNGATPNNITDAVDSAGVATTIDLSYAEFGGSDSGVAGTARNYVGPYPAAVSGQAANALLDVIFSRDSAVQFTLSDLDPAKTYDLLLYGSTNRAGISDYTVTGGGGASTISLVTSEWTSGLGGTPNATDVALFTGIAPNGSNQITIDMVSNNTANPNVPRGFAVINTLVVSEVVPEPSSTLLVGLGALGLMGCRRR
ncbi:MAG: PEP-CTERM sorting domain-containing protein [Akkermansiaceae bacterium]